MKTAAVLVGINNYKFYPEDQLRGCVDDANNLWMWLVNKLGFDKGNVLILKDLAETAAGEKSSVQKMITGAGPGDRLLWSHSSHGTNNPDPTQRDGLQELLCCSDIKEKNDVWDLDTVISAKWIGEAIAKLHPQATLDIIIDACHAPEGSQLKALGRSYNRAKFLPRSEVIVPVVPKTLPTAQYVIPANICLWSACQPDQTSADAYIDNSWQGAFTAAFLRSAKGGGSRVDIIARARQWLAVNHYQQTPHLYGHSEMVQRGFGT